MAIWLDILAGSCLLGSLLQEQSLTEADARLRIIQQSHVLCATLSSSVCAELVEANLKYDVGAQPPLVCLAAVECAEVHGPDGNCRMGSCPRHHALPLARKAHVHTVSLPSPPTVLFSVVRPTAPQTFASVCSSHNLSPNAGAPSHTPGHT